MRYNEWNGNEDAREITIILIRMEKHTCKLTNSLKELKCLTESVIKIVDGSDAIKNCCSVVNILKTSLLRWGTLPLWKQNKKNR